MWRYFILTLTVLLTACAVTTPQAYYESLPKEWTHQQKMTAFFYSLQKETTSVTPTGRNLRRDLVSINEALYMAERIRADIDWLINNENEDYIKYLLWTKSQYSIKESKGVWDFLAKCLRAYQIQGDLAQKLGIKLEDPLLRTKNYQQNLIIACPQLGNQLKLLDPRVEEAIKTGRLLPSQVIKLDLADPLGTVTLEATTYLIEPDSAQTPEEALNKFYAPGIYAEIRREGESFPIVRLYRSPESDRLNLIVIDSDNPEQFGYGLPDKLDTVSLANALEYIAREARNLIPREFQAINIVRKKKVPQVEEIYIVRNQGEVFQTWEEGEFVVPIDYQTKDFIADVKLKRTNQERTDGLKEVEFFTANYYDAKVIEYYEPLPDYRLIKDFATIGQNIELQLKGKPNVSAPPEALGKLVYVMYLEGNNKGWILWDSDGDGKFDKKRSIVWQNQ